MDVICKEIRELASKRNELTCENRSLEYDIQIVKEELNVLCDDISHMKEELPFLKKELAKQNNKEAFEDEIKGKNDDIKEMQCEVRQLCKKTNKIQLCSTTLQDEVCHCKEHIKALENSNCNLKNKLRGTHMGVDKLQREKRDQESNIEESKRNLANLKRCLDKVSAELQEKCFEVDFVLENLKTNENCIASMTNKDNELQKKIVELQENYYKLQSKMRHEGCNNEKLREKLSSAHEDADNVKNQMECYEKELEERKQQRLSFLQEIREEMGKLKKGEECTRRPEREHGKSKKNQFEMVQLEHACEESLKRFSKSTPMNLNVKPSSSFDLTVSFEPPSKLICKHVGKKRYTRTPNRNARTSNCTSNRFSSRC